MTDVLDWRGKKIEVGALIVYATTASSSIYMNEAIVAKIEFVPQTRYNYSIDPGTNKRIQQPYTVQNPVLYVRKTIKHIYSTNTKKDQSKLQKLTRVDRVTVVEPRNAEKCNELGCTADLGHGDPRNLDYWPAHSFEREE